MIFASARDLGCMRAYVSRLHGGVRDRKSNNSAPPFEFPLFLPPSLLFSLSSLARDALSLAFSIFACSAFLLWRPETPSPLDPLSVHLPSFLCSVEPLFSFGPRRHYLHDKRANVAHRVRRALSRALEEYARQFARCSGITSIPRMEANYFDFLKNRHFVTASTLFFLYIVLLYNTYNTS